MLFVLLKLVLAIFDCDMDWIEDWFGGEGEE
jgi:hypothetical protein